MQHVAVPSSNACTAARQPPAFHHLTSCLPVEICLHFLVQVYQGGIGSYALFVMVAAFLLVHPSRHPVHTGSRRAGSSPFWLLSAYLSCCMQLLGSCKQQKASDEMLLFIRAPHHPDEQQHLIRRLTAACSPPEAFLLAGVGAGLMLVRTGKVCLHAVLQKLKPQE